MFHLFSRDASDTTQEVTKPTPTKISRSTERKLTFRVFVLFCY